MIFTCQVDLRMNLSIVPFAKEMWMLLKESLEVYFLSFLAVQEFFQFLDFVGRSKTASTKSPAVSDSAEARIDSA